MAKILHSLLNEAQDVDGFELGAYVSVQIDGNSLTDREIELTYRKLLQVNFVPDDLSLAALTALMTGLRATES